MLPTMFRKGFPVGIIGQESVDCGCKLLRRVSDLTVESCYELEPFCSNGGSDDRKAKREGLSYLSFYPCSISERCYEYPRALEEKAKIRNPSMDNDSLNIGKIKNCLWCVASGDVEEQVGLGLVDGRKDFPGEPLNSIYVGNVPEASDEKKVSSVFGDWIGLWWNLKVIGYQVDPCFWGHFKELFTVVD